MTINKELKDYATTDPFTTAKGFTLKENDPNDRLLKEVFHSVMPPEEWEKNPLITTPASQPRNVINAVPSHDCRVCGQKVWMSPSSLALDLSKVFIICTPCVQTAFEKVTKVSPWHER